MASNAKGVAADGAERGAVTEAEYSRVMSARFDKSLEQFVAQGVCDSRTRVCVDLEFRAVMEFVFAKTRVLLERMPAIGRGLPLQASCSSRATTQ